MKQVQAALGHATPSITLTVYSHLWPGDADKTRAILDAALDVLRTPGGLDDLREDKAAGQAGDA